MKQGLFTIAANRPLTPWVWQMDLVGDCAAIARPGQFVNLQIPGFYLRRPISVCDVNFDAPAPAPDGSRPGTLTLVYKVVGGGTEAMSAMSAGQAIDVLTGLGNGYDFGPCGDKPLLVGGGVGVPPLYWAARQLVDGGKQVSAILAFNTADEVFYEDEFRALGVDVHVVTVDGSRGTQGFATAVLPDIDYTYFYTCGPAPMMRALYSQAATSGQFSMEERMGCGFGACMGCTCKTASGHARVCKEGPVFAKEEIEWDA